MQGATTPEKPTPGDESKRSWDSILPPADAIRLNGRISVNDTSKSPGLSSLSKIDTLSSKDFSITPAGTSSKPPELKSQASTMLKPDDIEPSSDKRSGARGRNSTDVSEHRDRSTSSKRSVSSRLCTIL